jgi:hypothetical protein
VPSPTPDELVALGLYDPDDELAAERLELIEYLLSLGATVDELVAAYPDLAQVASTRALLGPGERFTQAEAAARAGIPIEAWARIWRAAGLPDPGPDARVCTEEDVEMLRTFDAGAALLGEDVVIQVAGHGSSMASPTAIAAFVVNVAGPSLGTIPVAEPRPRTRRRSRCCARPREPWTSSSATTSSPPTPSARGPDHPAARGRVRGPRRFHRARGSRSASWGPRWPSSTSLVDGGRGRWARKPIGDEVMFVVAVLGAK